MVKVSPDIKAIFEKQRVIPMATADKMARPNVILVGMWYWADDETLVVSENYLNKTKANLEEKPSSPSTAGQMGRATRSGAGSTGSLLARDMS